jgi:NAD(P) transhydrogenase subunit alpha
MSTVTGYKSVVIAADHFPKFIPMIGTAIGTIAPAQFLILGAGVVGLQAIATAKRLGGVVIAVDIREDARQGAVSLGVKVPGFEVPDDFARGEGGYAKALPADWLERERAFLAPLVAEADIVIASALVPGEVAPILITEPMVDAMKPGSVLVDVAIDQGGNCAVTEGGKSIERDGVWICGRQNIPGSTPVHASWLYEKNMRAFVANLFKKGIETPDFADVIAAHCLVTRGGQIHHQGALRAMQAA